jgi:hypothetical protein
MIRRKKSKIAKPKKPKKSLVYNGIKFKSPLEIYAYQQLELAGIKFGYENVTYILQEGFTFKNATYRRIGIKKKKRMVYEETAKIQQISHRPDFNGEGWILETKGEIKPENVLRIKMLKYYLNFNKLKTVYFMAHNQKDVLHCIELIKEL